MPVGADDLHESVKAPGWLLYRTRNEPSPPRVSFCSASAELNTPWNHLRTPRWCLVMSSMRGFITIGGEVGRTAELGWKGHA
jgi:hypothetical protein